MYLARVGLRHSRQPSVKCRPAAIIHFRLVHRVFLICSIADGGCRRYRMDRNETHWVGLMFSNPCLKNFGLHSSKAVWMGKSQRIQMMSRISTPMILLQVSKKNAQSHLSFSQTSCCRIPPDLSAGCAAAKGGISVAAAGPPAVGGGAGAMAVDGDDSDVPDLDDLELEEGDGVLPVDPASCAPRPARRAEPRAARRAEPRGAA